MRNWTPSLRVISRWVPGIRTGLGRLQKRITSSASQLIYIHSSFGDGNLSHTLSLYIKYKLHPMEKLSETKSSVAGHPEETEVLPHLSYSAHSGIHRWGILWSLVSGVGTVRAAPQLSVFSCVWSLYVPFDSLFSLSVLVLPSCSFSLTVRCM